MYKAIQMKRIKFSTDHRGIKSTIVDKAGGAHYVELLKEKNEWVISCRTDRELNGKKTKTINEAKQILVESGCRY